MCTDSTQIINASDEVLRQAAKQQLAIAAQQLLQDPERQLPQLNVLLKLLRNNDGQVLPIIVGVRASGLPSGAAQPGKNP